MIVVPRAIYDDLVAHAREGAPEEVCGILGGQFGELDSTITTAHRTHNASANPVRQYAMDPEDQLEQLEAIEEQGQEVLGFYHSHPAGPPAPSQTDAAQATWSGYSYVIVAMDGEPYVGSWRWNDEEDRFEAEVVRLTRD